MVFRYFNIKKEPLIFTIKKCQTIEVQKQEYFLLNERIKIFKINTFLLNFNIENFFMSFMTLLDTFIEYFKNFNKSRRFFLILF